MLTSSPLILHHISYTSNKPRGLLQVPGITGLDVTCTVTMRSTTRWNMSAGFQVSCSYVICWMYNVCMHVSAWERQKDSNLGTECRSQPAIISSLSLNRLISNAWTVVPTYSHTLTHINTDSCCKYAHRTWPVEWHLPQSMWHTAKKLIKIICICASSHSQKSQR